MSNYHFEHAPTESSAGSTLLFVANHLHKTCSDLNIYKNMNYNQPKSNNQPKKIKYCCWHHLQKSKNVKKPSEKN